MEAQKFVAALMEEESVGEVNSIANYNTRNVSVNDATLQVTPMKANAPMASDEEVEEKRPIVGRGKKKQGKGNE